MSYKVYLWDNLDPIEWSQAAWRVEGEESTATCKQEFLHGTLLEHLPKNGLIVDAGCGTARWPIYLRRLGYRCLGIEISHDACLLARRADPDIPLVQGDTRHTPLRDGAADAVLSLGVVEHDEAGPIAGLRELHRILKPDGLLAVAVPYNNPFRRLVMNHLLTLVTLRRRRAGMSLGFAEYRFDRREMRGFLRAAGFEPIAEYPNDLVPPKIMGLWVDFDNLIFSPFRPSGPDRIFILPGLRGRIGRRVLRHFPWLVCGEALFVARRQSARP
jgi:SAM-dependent methyltransferase